MRQRITLALAVAAVAVIAAIVGYLWRVFRLSQTGKTHDVKSEGAGNRRDLECREDPEL
jgi:hypothetical protein